MNMWKIRILITASLISIQIFIFAQEFTPIVNQYSKKDYNASNQNWDVKQAADGKMCFGNNQGLLQFDGSSWKVYKIPGNKIIRSLYISSDKKIYVGSFEEFGYFEKDNKGKLVYSSISDKCGNYKMHNDEIWNILEYDGKIIFQSFTSFFTYDTQDVRGKRFPLTFLFFQKFKNKIYTHTEQNGLCYYDKKKEDFVPVNNAPFKSAVVAILPINHHEAFIVTKADGIYIFNGINFSRFLTNTDRELSGANINKAMLTKDSLLVIGTIQNGVTALNYKGQKVWTLNTSNVLQNNTVLGIYCDQENNLWLALDKGISMLRLGKSLNYIHSFSPSIGAIYSVNFQEPDNLFIATNQGFYRAKLNLVAKRIENVTLDPRITGQVWDISRFDNQFFCGNNEQTYEVDKTQSKIVSPVKGGICISKGIIHGKEVLVQGTYTELCIYEKKNNVWIFSHSVSNFLNPIQYIEVDYKGTIWAAHLHAGLYAIRLKEDLRTIESLKVYKSLDNVHKVPINVFSINNRIVFTDNMAFYTYDDIQKKIIPYDLINNSLGRFSQAYRVCSSSPNYYWFIRNDEAALVKIQNDKINIIDQIQNSLFLNQTVDNYQNIFYLKDKMSLITLENGLALYERQNGKMNLSKYKLQISKVEVSDRKNRKIINFPVVADSEVKISYKNNNIRFSVFYPVYSHLNNLSFRYRLIGLDDVWSRSTPENSKEYSYLSPGKYTFEVQALSNSNDVLSTVSYDFLVRPPFYWNTFSKILYILLLTLMVYFAYWLVKRNFRIKKQKIHEEQEAIRKKEIEKREQQIIALKNEKLESEIVQKSKELAVSTMTIIKKNELMNTIKDEIVSLKNKLGTQYPNKYYDKLIKLLDENISSEDDWAIFQANFDRIHENFFRNLHVTYSELTANDLRFCAFFRLNLSTKDIAHLMNISLKGVEVARYRIRKKMNIPSEKNISEFLIEFK